MEGTQGRPVHGGLNFGELKSLGLRPEEVTDFSASINPLGPSLKALEALREVNLAAYPDPECLELRRAIGDSVGVDTECILPGNGSTELIHLLARAFLSPDDSALIFSPTFGEYEAACLVEGVEPVSVLPPATGKECSRFLWSLSVARALMDAHSPSLVFLCNPNNPTGVYLDRAEIKQIAESLPAGGLLVLDEAYVSFVNERWDSTPLLAMGNIALLRSMTKDYAVTGLRLGYLLAPKGIIRRVRAFQYSWSVNSAAQAAGVAALADGDHVNRGREAAREGKEFLIDTAMSLGLEYTRSAANFLLLRVGDATGLRHELLTRHRVCVRDCTSFGLPDYIRVGVRTMEDNRRLAEALREVLAKRAPFV